MRKKLAAFLVAIVNERKKAEKFFLISKKSAEEIAASASASPSQSGDRFHSQGSADMAKGKLNSILRLEDEVKNVINSDISMVVSVPCYVRLKENEIYLVKNVVMIPNFKVVSSSSPLALKIIGNKVGENKILEIG